MLRDDADAELRRLAAGALEDIDPPVPVLRAALTDPDRQRRLWAIGALIEKGPEGHEALSALILALQKDDDAAVRAGAALVLGKLGTVAREAGAVLIERLRDPIPRVREAAALALGLIGPGVEGAAPALAQALADSDSGVGEASATALGNLGPGAEGAVPVLAGFLKGADAGRRGRAVNVLARIGVLARGATPELLEALHDPDITVRRDACRALVSVGPQATAPQPILVEALRCRETPIDTQVRAWAGLSLAAAGAASLPALPALLDALQDEAENVRACAGIALGQLGPGAVPALVKALEHLHPNVRGGSALALGSLGAGARRAVPGLSRSLHDEDPHVASAAALALGRIASALQLQQEPSDLPALQDVQAILDGERPTAPGSPEETQWLSATKQVRTATAALVTAQRAHLFDRLLASSWGVSLIALASGIMALLGLWSMLLLLRPLRLLRLGELMQRLPHVHVPVLAGNVELSFNHLLLLSFFQYRPRALDAWVKHCRDTLRKNFDQQRVVREHAALVPAPVVLDGQLLPAPEPRRLGAAFAGQRGCLLIAGESGSGKTGLACRIAQWALADDPARRLCSHPMLPVLLDAGTDLTVPSGPSANTALTEIVRGRLQVLVGPENPVSAPLLDALLRQRRVLVIVDCFSEMSATDRDLLRPGRADFPVHALVVASRREEALDGVPRCVVQLPALGHGNAQTAA
jgi:HEAT repeat protein